MMGVPPPTTPPTVFMWTRLTMPSTGLESVVRSIWSLRTTSCSSSMANSFCKRTNSPLASCLKRLMRSVRAPCNSLTCRVKRMTSTLLISPWADMRWAISSSRCTRLIDRLAPARLSSRRRRRLSKDSVSAARSALASLSSGGKTKLPPLASARKRATVAVSALRLSSPSFCEASIRVGSKRTTA